MMLMHKDGGKKGYEYLSVKHNHALIRIHLHDTDTIEHIRRAFNKETMCGINTRLRANQQLDYYDDHSRFRTLVGNINFRKN